MNPQSRWVRYEDHRGHLIKRVLEPMELIKNKIKQEPEKVNRTAFLELAKKDEKGIPQPNGVHRVKLLGGEEGNNKDYMGNTVEGIWLKFDEDGVEKKYFVPTYITDKNRENYGKFHYLFEKFEHIPEGTILEMEYVKKGKGGYIDVRPVNMQIDDIPIIEEDGTEDISY